MTKVLHGAVVDNHRKHSSRGAFVDPGLEEWQQRLVESGMKRDDVLIACGHIHRSVSLRKKKMSAGRVCSPKPVVCGKAPRWFHPLGMTMKVQECNIPSRILVLWNDGGATVRIQQSLPQDGNNDSLWEVSYYLHDGEDTISTNWRGLFDANQLAEAFTQYGVSSVTRLFFRDEVYLSMPVRGTPCPGDPNVSIYVTDTIRDAVERLLTV